MLSEEIKSSPGNSGRSEQASSNHEREFQEWARSLGIHPARLKQAVSAVGIAPRKIREYLRRNQ
jgi:hypothetical protein